MDVDVWVFNVVSGDNFGAVFQSLCSCCLETPWLPSVPLLLRQLEGSWDAGWSAAMHAGEPVGAPPQRNLHQACVRLSCPLPAEAPPSQHGFVLVSGAARMVEMDPVLGEDLKGSYRIVIRRKLPFSRTSLGLPFLILAVPIESLLECFEWWESSQTLLLPHPGYRSSSETQVSPADVVPV